MPDILRRRSADAENDVITVVSDPAERRTMMTRPCPECPWRRANAGSFPAEAFRISAPTAYDLATHTFGCHTAGAKEPRTCAGAAVRTGHSLALRMRGEEVAQVEDIGDELFDDYREMAEANGVDPEDEVLRPCR